MRIKKMYAVVAGISIVAAAFSGCGYSEKESAKTAQKDASAEASSTESKTGSDEEDDVDTSNAEYTLKLAHDANTTSAFHLSALEIQKEIEEKSDGRIKVEVYPAQQLGSASEMIEGMQMGTIEATLLPTAKYGGFDETMTILDMPFLFPDEDTFYDIMNGDLGEKVMEKLPDIGITGCAFYGNGFKAITNNVREIHTPADMKGLKIRTMEAPLIMDMYKEWGSNPVPVDFSELYSSLQQNVVDGQENPFLTISDMKFYEVQKYMSITNHAYLSYVLTFSTSFLDSLPDDLRQIVLDCGKSCVDYHREQMKKLSQQYYDNIAASDIQIYTLTDEEKKEFREASQPIYKKYRDTIGGDLLDAVVKAASE